MPPQKRVRESSKSNSGGLPGDAAGEEPSLLGRLIAFCILMLALAAVAVWFVRTAVRSPGTPDPKSLSARQEVRYAVKVLAMPAGREQVVRSMLESKKLLSLADGHSLHLQPLGQDELALCMGQFGSQQSPEARQLLKRIRQVTRQGRRAFPSAEIIGYTPPK
jgi:hypothetical protein